MIDLEVEHRRDDNVEIVLIGSDSIETVMQTHSNLLRGAALDRRPARAQLETLTPAASARGGLKGSWGRYERRAIAGSVPRDRRHPRADTPAEAAQGTEPPSRGDRPRSGPSSAGRGGRARLRGARSPSVRQAPVLPTFGLPCRPLGRRAHPAPRPPPRTRHPQATVLPRRLPGRRVPCRLTTR